MKSASLLTLRVMCSRMPLYSFMSKATGGRPVMSLLWFSCGAQALEDFMGTPRVCVASAGQ